MSEPTLFDVPVQLSPKLAWFKNHDVKTHYFANDWDDYATLNHLSFGHWVAYVGKFPRHADEGIWACAENSEDDALVSLAKGMKWKLWNEETGATKPLNSHP